MGHRWRRKPHVDDQSPAGVYAGLRAQILALDPASAGLTPTPTHPTVWGVMMETGYARGTATLVALADGTTSLYLSTGGGIIGGGGHAQVVAATDALLRTAAAHLHRIPPQQDDALPPEGEVAIRALTYTGLHAANASEDDLGYGRHELSPVFHAAHEVITQLRLIHDGPPEQRGTQGPGAPA